MPYFIMEKLTCSQKARLSSSWLWVNVMAYIMNYTLVVAFLSPKRYLNKVMFFICKPQE